MHTQFRTYKLIQQMFMMQDQSTKSTAFLYTNLTKAVQDLYTENYKTLLKKIKLHKCKDILCSRIGRSNIVKREIVPKAIHRINLISIKYL